MNSPTLVRADLLWQAARCRDEGQNLELAREKPNMIGQVTDSAESIKSPTNAETRLTRRTEQKGGGVELPTNFTNLTPMARTLALAQISAPDILITEFCDLRAQTNIVRAVQGCLTSVSSGVNCCLRFCDALGTPAFPITQAKVRRRGATFNPGKTYGLYAKHLRKADVMLGYEPTWHSAEIRTVANELADAQDKSFAFSKFAHPVELFMISEHGNRPTVARAAYIP